MIAVVNSSVANLSSVMAALQRLNAEAEITDDPATIRAASHVILPGVGAAPAAMANLRAKGLVDVLRGLTQPTLGICLGMQMLFEASEEGEGAECLGVLPGTIKLMPALPDKPIPHMGWNNLAFEKPEHPLLRGVADGAFVYFVHSFAASLGPCTVARADYTMPFTALAARGNFMGCQFHPERSGAAGSQILKNFLEL